MNEFEKFWLGTLLYVGASCINRYEHIHCNCKPNLRMPHSAVPSATSQAINSFELVSVLSGESRVARSASEEELDSSCPSVLLPLASCSVLLASKSALSRNVNFGTTMNMTPAMQRTTIKGCAFISTLRHSSFVKSLTISQPPAKPLFCTKNSAMVPNSKQQITRTTTATSRDDQASTTWHMCINDLCLLIVRGATHSIASMAICKRGTTTAKDRKTISSPRRPRSMERPWAKVEPTLKRLYCLSMASPNRNSMAMPRISKLNEIAKMPTAAITTEKPIAEQTPMRTRLEWWRLPSGLATAPSAELVENCGVCVSAMAAALR
mmetsp:Transcript_89606/g.227922  ORF Transcript_89606/g.227922 Transcript_89606/m.227922 type:complete len:322 (+) Transcript_89606:139-1104(+)